jgi:anti-sigma regulatory factor (Ser/Thr protein kinase)
MPYYRCPACGLTSYSAAGYSDVPACPSCSGELPADARLYPGIERGIARELRSRPEAVAEARHALVGLALPQATRDKLALLVSELMTNAVRHTRRPPGDPVNLEVVRDARRVRLTVRDRGQGFEPPVLHHRAPLTGGGRGLAIVDALSDAWGVDRAPDSCAVWCEVAAA